jgi:hypothetical protein
MAIGHDDVTPTDSRSTIEIFADDMKATKIAVQNTETIQLEMYEAFKAHRQEMADLRQRTWLPALLSVAAALISAACAYAAAGH